MAIKTYKPTSPGRRFYTKVDSSEITKDKPEKKLTISLRKSGGRNACGRLTVRHRGGGHKRRYRIIDFRRDKYGVEGKVISIEYDPNRSPRIALIEYKDGERRYIIHPQGLKVGDRVESGENAPPSVGNSLPLSKIPVGTLIPRAIEKSETVIVQVA